MLIMNLLPLFTLLDRFDLIVLLALCSLRSLVMVEIQMVMTTMMKDITKDASGFRK